MKLTPLFMGKCPYYIGKFRSKCGIFCYEGIFHKKKWLVQPLYIQEDITVTQLNYATFIIRAGVHQGIFYSSPAEEKWIVELSEQVIEPFCPGKVKSDNYMFCYINKENSWNLCIIRSVVITAISTGRDKPVIEYLNTAWFTVYYRVTANRLSGLYGTSIHGDRWIFAMVYNSIDVKPFYSSGDYTTYMEEYHLVTADGKYGLIAETSILYPPLYDKIEYTGKTGTENLVRLYMGEFIEEYRFEEISNS
jgi:hypothetical protein